MKAEDRERRLDIIGREAELFKGISGRRAKWLLAEIRSLEAERDKLRKMLQWCAEETWEKLAIDGGDFQEAMMKAGLFVEVPISEQVREEWGDDWDTDMMFVTSWSPLAKGEQKDD